MIVDKCTLFNAFVCMITTGCSEAAKLVAPYYRQDEKVLNYVLTSEPRHVSYVQLTPSEHDFQQMQDMGLKLGLLKKRIPVSDYIDSDFIPQNNFIKLF